MKRKSVMKQTKKKIVWLVAFLGINTIGLCTEPFAKGPYLGEYSISLSFVLSVSGCQHSLHPMWPVHQS